ncbi:MAG: long-chain fatty acid--CoA ligase [Polyangiaceae bacterium]
MLDLSQFEQPKIAPRAVFDALAEKRSRPRFMVPSEGGDWRAVTWGAFAEGIERAAAHLVGVGIELGDRGAVFAPNRVEWLMAALGIQAAGGVMVPIYPASTPDQAAYVIEHSDAKVVFVDTAPLLSALISRWNALGKVARIVTLDDAVQPMDVLRALRERGAMDLPSAADVEAKIVSWSRAQAAGAAALHDAPSLVQQRMDAVSLDQPGLMLYTSGTTGNPKGVPLTHRNVSINGLDWLRNNAPVLEEGYVDLLWLPMSHIFGFGEACLGNTLGFTSYLTDPVSVLSKLPEVKPNVLMSVPAYWEKLAIAAGAEPEGDARRKRLAELTGGRLRFCLSGGAGLKREVKELFYSCGLLIIEGYGLTECSPTLTLNRPGAFRFDSVGQPLPSVQLKLAEDGEILAKGPTVFSGYHKDEAATREAFDDDGWFKTGDVGRFTDDGFLQIVDRKKEILVTAGGKNVPPANIELRFADEPLVQHAVVYGDGKKYLVLGLWLDPEQVDRALGDTAPQARSEAIRTMAQEAVDRVNAHLAKFEQIKSFRIMDEPLTVSGGLLTSTLKVRRKQVYARFAPQFEGMYGA